eukprot:TRINITY_DN26661_c0_g1_i3.p1 TRINITY_DN26661_c0_g1~~TRINITY_DN26661_c0_g1_i3.p1  ORF type:complete len:377 (+),score=90.80 TRINITY_DN26661_c0_g1_i3:100-1230(+)
MIRRPPRSTLSSSSAASDVYKRQVSTQSTGSPNCSPMRYHLLPLLLALASAGMDITRPWQFSRAALNFAKEEGTGSFYSTGYFTGTMTLAHKEICSTRSCYKVPSLKVKSSGLADIWIAKYNRRNQLLWAKKAGGAGEDEAEAIALSNTRDPPDAPYKDVFITGTIQGKAWFDSTKTVSALSGIGKSVFIAKYNTSDGSVRWTKLAATCATTRMHADLGERVVWKDSHSYCNSRAIGLDPNGDLIITGKFYGTLNFGGKVHLMSGTNCRTRAGTGRVCEHSVYLAKFRHVDGSFVWADKVADPFFTKTNTASQSFADPSGGSPTVMTVKDEFRLWANRSVELYRTRLDEDDTERVTDNWPLGTDGLNTNLYRMNNV